MKRLAALLLMLTIPCPAHDSENHLEWWEAGVFGSCTRTDIVELGGCGRLEVRRKPKWE